MPKTSNTRKQRAAELLRLATKGPDTDLKFFPVDVTVQQRRKIEEHYRAAYRLWSTSWVLPLMRQLVPELKDRK